MIFELVNNWEVGIDGIQICLCLLIIMLLIRKGVKRNQMASQARTKDFDTEIYSEVIKQQAAQAFEHISETIAGERRNLERVLQISQLGGKPINESNFQDQLASLNLNEISPRRDDQMEPLPYRDQIQRLAIKGMSVRKISEKLEIPMGEVELIVNLDSGANWNH